MMTILNEWYKPRWGLGTFMECYLGMPYVWESKYRREFLHEMQKLYDAWLADLHNKNPLGEKGFQL